MAVSALLRQSIGWITLANLSIEDRAFAREPPRGNLRRGTCQVPQTTKVFEVKVEWWTIYTEHGRRRKIAWRVSPLLVTPLLSIFTHTPRVSVFLWFHARAIFVYGGKWTLVAMADWPP